MKFYKGFFAMQDFLWWRDGIIYQIYPRSFADSNNDGLGDLPGIISKLDYLAELGVDAIWLSPIYPSPDKDFGYDVADYVDIDPRFGSLKEFDLLLSEAHKRGLHIILDLVLNHTSDQHAWFQESRSSRDNPKADWFIWRPSDDPASNFNSKASNRLRVPNNWQSVFGGQAWTYIPERDQYYFHMFLPEQPDVNWRNPETRQALLDVVRFWLERGVDGFRLDVFNIYFKDDLFRENPHRLGIRAFDRQNHLYDCDRPELVPLLEELRAILDSYPERYAVGETFLPTQEKITRYSGANRLHAAFDFDFLWSRFDPDRLLGPILAWEKLFSAHRLWPNYVLGNHDARRVASRHTRNERDERLKVLMALLLTLRGTPFLYYGEEIGMRDISLKRSEIIDPPGKKYWPFYKGRDGCRAPMQWDSSPFAGFSAQEPWLPVHPNYKYRNVRAQQDDPASLFNLTRRLIGLRKTNISLQRGDFILLTPHPRGMLAFLRRTPDQTILVALNFQDRPTMFNTQTNELASTGNLLLSTARQAVAQNLQALKLAPYEVLIMEMD
jgi:alpha-glucosidase